MRTTWIPRNGVNRRLTNATLAAFLVLSTLAIIPGGIPAAGATATDVDESQEGVESAVALECPFVASGDQILIDIVADTGGHLLGAPDIAPNALGPINTAVAAGTYTVQWASYDGHSIHGGLNQTQEQWYLDIGGSTSIDTGDIPEEPDYASGTLGTDLIVASDSPTVMIHHGGQPDTVNSVYALCALLEPVYPPTPLISIDKSTNGADADSAPGPSITIGETVTWTYVVTNTGEVDLTGVIVTDDILGDVCTIGDLAIGDSETCELVGAATAGQYANIGTAVDNNGDGSTVSATDPSHYFGQKVDASATIGDTVWSDDNANGKQDNGEKGIAGATVQLTLPDGSTADTTTNASGLYLFAALDGGTYRVELILSSIPKPSEGDLRVTTAGSFTVQLAADQSYLDADFGVVATLPNTGIESDQIAVIALALVLVGSMALFVTRKRKAFGGEDVIA
jgi:LPXTG-motif cell wall-anchored protein